MTGGFDLGAVSTDRLTRLLDDAHWERAGERPGLYVRYALPEGARSDRGSSLVVPLDRGAPDYEALLSEALVTLSSMQPDSPTSNLLTRLAVAPTDELSFAKQTMAPKGWIQWDQGMDLLKAARAFLASGAKSARERMSYYGNRYGQFANRFLDEVMMGQTAVSSYVVRAYVPADSVVAFKGGRDAEEAHHLVGADSLSGRDITSALVETLLAADDALDHYRVHQSLAAFTAPDTPLSYEAVQALKVVAQDARDSAVIVSLEGATAGSHEQRWEFNFTAAQVPVLERAASELVAAEPQRPVTATGIVHLLSRSEAGGPGVIGITTLSGEPAKKLRVRLSPDDYHRALSAHDQGAAVRVAGALEREGSLSWLYNANLISVSEPVAEAATSQDEDVQGDRLF